MKKLTLILTSALLGISQLNAADGKTLYNNCLPCHQATGQGIAGAFPPLAESEWVNGPIENLIRIQLRGINGPLDVKGTTYNGVMPAMAQQTDEEIAAVLTYVRSNFGNNSSEVTADQVKALRSEVGKPMVTAADLIDPLSDEGKAIAAKENGEGGDEATDETTEDGAPAAKPEATEGEVKHSEKKAGPNYLVIGSIAVWSVICIIPVVIGIGRRS